MWQGLRWALCVAPLQANSGLDTNCSTSRRSRGLIHVIQGIILQLLQPQAILALPKPCDAIRLMDIHKTRDYVMQGGEPATPSADAHTWNSFEIRDHIPRLKPKRAVVNGLTTPL